MKKSDLISAYMQMEYGRTGSYFIKQLVNEAMDQGEWQDGFDIAVSIRDLNDDESRKLYGILKKAYPEVVFDTETIEQILDKECIDLDRAAFSWIVDSDGSILMTDGYRVVKILDNQLIWISDRAPWGGICLLTIVDAILIAVIAAWNGPGHNDAQEWLPLNIAILDGKVLEGPTMESNAIETILSESWFNKSMKYFSKYIEKRAFE